MSYSTSDLSRRTGDIIAEALRRPVTLTQHNKPRLVLMNIEDYQKLLQRGDPRKAHTINSMPDDVFEDFKHGVELYAIDGDNG